jgi:hypothetical protein
MWQLTPPVCFGDNSALPELCLPAECYYSLDSTLRFNFNSTALLLSTGQKSQNIEKLITFLLQVKDNRPQVVKPVTE